jgi:hypothetical protein
VRAGEQLAGKWIASTGDDSQLLIQTVPSDGSSPSRHTRIRLNTAGSSVGWAKVETNTHTLAVAAKRGDQEVALVSVDQLAVGHLITL